MEVIGIAYTRQTEAENDAKNAELEWSARERSPSPPKERLS